MENEKKIAYRSGLVTVTTLTEEEMAEYRKLKPGVHQTADRIRWVAIEDGTMQIIEYTANGVNRIKFRL